MRIRFVHPAAVRANYAPGDEIVVKKLTPELETLLVSTRLDGQHVAQLVDEHDDEVATVEASGETATTGRGRRGSQRAAPVSQ